MDRWTNFILIGLVLLLGLSAIGCNQSAEKSGAVRATPASQGKAAVPGGPGAAPPPAEVVVALPRTGQITDHEDFTGRTVANKTIEIRARVTGYIDKINFIENEGRDVESGSVLFEIDPRLYEAEVARAQANLLQTQTRLKRIELDYDRALKTVASRTITQEQFDQVAGDRAEAKAEVEIMKANLDLARLNLSYTKVTAPISGRVSRRQLDQGNLVRADETVLATIVSMDPMYAYFELDERTLLKLRRAVEDEGMISTRNENSVPIQMALADEEGYPHEGVVNYFDNQLDAGTGTLQARAVFDNRDRMLAPGMFVRVRLPIGRPYQALLIPEQALGTDQGQKFVYVVDDQNRAQYRRLEVGKLERGERVVLGGITASDRVIVSGLQRVRPGEIVAPRADEKPTATAGAESGATPESAAGAPTTKTASHQ